MISPDNMRLLYWAAEMPRSSYSISVSVIHSCLVDEQVQRTKKPRRKWQFLTDLYKILPRLQPVMDFLEYQGILFVPCLHFSCCLWNVILVIFSMQRFSLSVYFTMFKQWNIKFRTENVCEEVNKARKWTGLKSCGWFLFDQHNGGLLFPSL